MPNIFVNAKQQDITTVTTVYTAPASTTGIVLQLDIANVHATDTASVDVEHVSGATGTHMVKSVALPVGSTLEVSANGKKIVLEATDFIRVTSDKTVDVTMSIMEKS